MRIDPIKQYAILQKKLTEEKRQLESRLRDINAVLRSDPSAPTTITTAKAATPGPIRGVGIGEKSLTMREAIMQALCERGPLARKELGQAVQEMGYVSKAKNPLGSMGIILYAKDSPFRKKGGKFYPPATSESPAPASTTETQAVAKKKRIMSPEAKAKIAAAQKARWAKFRRTK